jgi:tRNA nucleotidyltransferase (CCA-adding enzyme)
MSRSLLARLPKGLVHLLRAIGSVGDTRGCAAYLVGGLVRDIVLRRENYDIDIVVESDAIAYARAVAQKFHAQGFVSYPRFGTATVLLKWPRSIPCIRKQAVMRIDFSTARKEQYEYPAALPSVERASIREDLLRRDFTMNAMALCLDQRRFGTLLDYFSGRKDIADKKIAVLHENSFIDDPTRIFRAVRFASR